MSKVRCYECKKTYDYQEDGFCPRCGCFNQPPSARRIDANGNIVYLDGINERNHEGSFVHKEYHKENRKRAFTPLEMERFRPKAKLQFKSVSEEGCKNIGKILVWIAFVFFAFLELIL